MRGSGVVSLWFGRTKDFLDELLALADGRSGRPLGRDTALNRDRRRASAGRSSRPDRSDGEKGYRHVIGERGDHPAGLANAAKNGLDVVSETKYPLTTTDFGPYLREAQQSSPDILFYCAYLNDSVGLIRAIAESDMNPLLVGGAMIGPQSSAVQTQLGSVINGIVNYEYWLPVPAMNFPGVHDLITDYQQRAKGTPADELGYYVAPFAYAQAQVLEQAVEATGGLNDAELADYAREATFSTVVGDVAFGRLGEWAVPRVLTVQFRGIGSSDIADFAKPEARVVVAPASYASGELVVPYRAAAAAR